MGGVVRRRYLLAQFCCQFVWVVALVVIAIEFGAVPTVLYCGGSFCAALAAGLNAALSEADR